MPEQPIVAMVKDGARIEVDERCVAAHREAGWRVAIGNTLDVQVRVTDFPEVQDLIHRAEEMAALLDEKNARIAELEAALAEHEPAPVTDDLKTRIAELEAKRAAGTLGKTEPALLARLQNKLAKLEGRA